MRTLPHHVLYVGGLGTGVSLYRERGHDQHRIALITKDLHGVTGLALDSSENVYVGSENNSTVTVYALGTKTPFETLTKAGLPYGLAVGNDGTLYVANRGTKTQPTSILVYSKGQTMPSRTISTHGKPFCLALDSSGNLYATVGGAVYEFAPGASSGKNLGLRGLGSGGTGIAVDKHRDLLVADNGQNAADVLVFPPGRRQASQKIALAYSSAVDVAINRENTEIWVTHLDGAVEGIAYPSGTLLDVVHHPGIATGVAVSPASNG